MKKLLLTSMMAVGLTMTTAAFAADKIAVADIQKAAADTTYMQKQRTSLENALKPQQQKMESLQKELVALQQKAQTDGQKLKPAELQKLQQDYANKLNEYNSNAASMQKRVQDTLDNINKTVAPKVEQVVQEVRKQGGYSVILHRNAVADVDAGADVTGQITQKLNAILK